MNNVDWQRVETIIDQALDLPIKKRTQFIDEECAGNLQLKSEVTLLLESIFDSEGWLEDPQNFKKDFYDEISSDVELLSAQQSLIGKEVGSYIIQQKIGEGGMGTVYLAERSDTQFDHRVAIKIIRHGRATEANIQRFKREQQILAGLNHPGIARLFDGGITSDGFPYIIMEYVDGIPLNIYCQKHNYTIEDKIALFEQVLEAVRHAHQNLVIHRDLKPGNILVNQSGDVKILDFGISKLLENKDNDSITETGARLLTPRYAAPEQIRQENITTATDLYTLGIVFYELLADTGPFEHDTLSRYKMEQAILKQEPPKPSTKTNTPKKLQGDLDAITLKAIRKEPEQRYRVANELLEDLKGYRMGLPVTAREDSFRYRSQKFFNRHKQGVTIAAGILLLVVGLTGFYTWRIAQERDQAELEAAKASQISDFLMSLFKANKPNQSKGDVVTAQMLLDTGIEQANMLSGQPAVQARMLSIIGEVQLDYGNYTKADSLFLAALEIEKSLENPNQQQRLAVMNNYGNLLGKKGEHKAADSVLTHVLIQSKNNDIPEQTTITLNDLGNNAHLESNFFKAESLHRQAFDQRIKLYGKKSKGVAASLNNIGLALHEQGELKQAEDYYRQSFQLDKQIYGKLHTETIMTMRNLGRLYMDMERMQKADSFLTKTVELTRQLLGNNHPRLAEELNELAVLKAREGNLSAADSLFKKILSIQKATLAADHPRIAMTLNNLAWVVKKLGKIKITEKYNRQALAIARQRFGTNHYNTAIYAHNLANVLQNQGKYKEAEPLYRKAVATLRKVLPPDHIRISDPLYDLGRLHRKTGRPNKGESLLREALSIRRKEFGQDHMLTALAQAALGNCLTDLKKYEEAKILLNESYNTLHKLNNNKSAVVKKMLTRLNEKIVKD